MKKLEIASKTSGRAIARNSALLVMACALMLMATARFGAKPARADGDVAFVVETMKEVVKPDNAVRISVTMQAPNAVPATAKFSDDKPALSNGQIKANLRPPVALFGPNDEPFTHGQLTMQISRTGRVGLQWPLPNGKPRDGKAMQFFDTIAAPNSTGGTLTQTVDWYGKSRKITINIRNKKGGGIIIGGGVILLPTPKPKFVSKQRMVGRNVSVNARLVVTNSDDGGFPVKDKTVEIKGWVQAILHKKSDPQPPLLYFFNWKNSKHDATKGNQFKSSIGPIKVFYSDPKTRVASIGAGLYDDDGIGSNRDLMLSCAQDVDLLQLMESGQELRITGMLGDTKSENADLYISVTDLGEFGLTPEQIKIIKNR